MNNILNTINRQSGGKSTVFQRVYSGMTENSVTDIDPLGCACMDAYQQFQRGVLPPTLVEDTNVVISRLADGMIGEHARLATQANSPETDAAKELYMTRHAEYTNNIPELKPVLANHTFDL